MPWNPDMLCISHVIPKDLWEVHVQPLYPVVASTHPCQTSSSREAPWTVITHAHR